MRHSFPLPFVLTCLIGVVPIAVFAIISGFSPKEDPTGFEGMADGIIQTIGFIIFLFFALLSGSVYYKNRFALVTALITLPMWLGIVAVVISSAISSQSSLQGVVLWWNAVSSGAGGRYICTRIA